MEAKNRKTLQYKRSFFVRMVSDPKIYNPKIVKLHPSVDKSMGFFDEPPPPPSPSMYVSVLIQSILFFNHENLYDIILLHVSQIHYL